MGELLVKDNITVETDHGPCQLELCIGSITKLKTKDSVDTLVISAFPGDYTPTARSVVGALQNDLKISVKQLARNKEEDLRKLFSCWWSKPLPKGLPYGRLLCFEGSYKRTSRPPTTISEVFRSLVSLTKNKDMTAIMPLLAAGDQGYDDEMMLTLIVDAAINWMQTGLPLKLLKIVLFARDSNKPDRRLIGIIDHFKTLKEKWLDNWKEEKVENKIIYDVYLSYSQSDKSFVERIAHTFQNSDRSLKIFTEHQEVDEDSCWQKKIHEVIVTCSRVVALLTPNYIVEDACIEQFNIAMCCSRKKNILVPFYMKEIIQMPTYMGLIQYMDCRSLDTDTVSNACIMVSSSFKIEDIRATKELDGKELATKEDELIVTERSLNEQYDVFISYSHKDTEVATAIVEYVRTRMPDWNVFFDQKDLRVGSTWQLKLYASIENTRFMLALLSENYMGSKVCQEEYNLARALNDDSLYPTKLMEIKLSAVDNWPVWCTPFKLFDLSEGAAVEGLVEEVLNEMNRSTEEIRAIPDIPIKETTSVWRQAVAKKKFPICIGTNFRDTSFLKEASLDNADKYDVMLCYDSRDELFANILNDKLVNSIPGIKVSRPKDETSLRLHEIDRATLIVPLLSKHYVSSSKLMEEFHTALCRHRFSEEIVIFPITVKELPLKPAYAHIVFSLYSIMDEIWGRDALHTCMSSAAAVICNILVREPKVTCAFRTLFSMSEIYDSIQKISKHTQLPLHYFSRDINCDAWCLDESGNPLSSKTLKARALAEESGNPTSSKTRKARALGNTTSP